MKENFGEQQNYDAEYMLSQEFLALEYRVMQKFFDIAGIIKHERGEWVIAHGKALRQMITKEPEFIDEYLKKESATREEFEGKLGSYL
ncbi:MAG: hypothetical protein Q7S11_02725 [bacterium]|nr:hypothetical protein [bacterium]